MVLLGISHGSYGMFMFLMCDLVHWKTSLSRKRFSKLNFKIFAVLDTDNRNQIPVIKRLLRFPEALWPVKQ